MRRRSPAIYAGRLGGGGGGGSGSSRSVRLPSTPNLIKKYGCRLLPCTQCSIQYNTRRPTSQGILKVRFFPNNAWHCEAGGGQFRPPRYRTEVALTELVFFFVSVCVCVVCVIFFFLLLCVRACVRACVCFLVLLLFVLALLQYF